MAQLGMWSWGHSGLGLKQVPRDHQILYHTQEWGNTPRSVPGLIDSFFTFLRIVLFFKVFKINTLGDSDQEEHGLACAECSLSLTVFLLTFFQTVHPLVQVPGGIDSDGWLCFSQEKTHWSYRNCSRHSGACTTQELCQRLFSERIPDFFLWFSVFKNKN